MKRNSVQLFSNVYLLGLILNLTLLSVFIWVFGSNLNFGFADSAYHLAVAQGFNRAGGITIWDFWDSLPLGRSHYYPPLLHLILADTLKLVSNPEIALKIITEFVVVGGMSIFSYGISKIYNLRVAFWSVLILSVSVQFIRVSTTVMPAALAIFLIPLLYYFYKKQKWISYILTLTLLFYIHLFLPFIIILGLAIYILIFEKEYFITALKATAISLLLYSPWLMHILWGGIKYIKYFDANYDIARYQNFPQTNFFLLLLFIISIIFLVHKKKFKRETYYFVILALLFLVLSIFSTNRMLNGHILVCFAIFIALFFDQFWKKIEPLVYFFALLSLFYYPNIAFSHNKLFIYSNQPTVTQIIFQEDFKRKTIEQSHRNLFDALKSNSQEREAIGTAVDYFGKDLIDKKEYQSNISILLAANSNRPTINLYQPEYNFRDLPDLSRARLILLSQPIDRITSEYFIEYGYSEKNANELKATLEKNSTLISSYPARENFEDDANSLIYLYKNNSNKNILKENLPKFIFPLWLANCVLVIMVCILILSARSKPMLRRNKID